jgi:glycosyltransferase involved in cell wall biosynthesis
MLFPVVFLRRLCSPTPVLLLHVESNVVSVRNPIRVALLKFVDVLSTKLASISFDKILYSTPMMGELYRELYEVPAEKISVWPNSVELSFSESSDATRTGHLRRQLGLVGRFGFLYHGALREGILELVEAFRILHASSVNVILVILGYGVREVVARYIQEHNLQEIVKLRGPVEHAEVPTYIAACDAGIVPLPDNIRWRYQNPIKILELLAMNKPIIVSDIPAHRWIIGNAPVAFYLRGTDPVSIAEGVRGFLALHDKLDPTRGQKIVQERFTPERVADILEKEILSRQTNVQ